MRNPTPPLILALVVFVIACGDDPPPPPQPRPTAHVPAKIEPESEPESRLTLKTKGGTSGYDSAYTHPESLLKPLDGFPLPSGARVRKRDRDLAVYEVQATLGTVESFYRERGFRITHPGKLPGLIVTRKDSGTRLQVQAGKHRVILLRFYR